MNNRGLVWHAKKDVDRARSDYTKVLVLGAENANAYNNIGLVWYETGHTDRMCTAYTRACDLGDCEKLTQARKDKLCP